MVREMIGGCCVCLDERGWNENPLVYCDGTGCSVAVHQACYGIVKVPSGPWFCCKCRSQERVARVKCELCPNKDGALKRTDTGGWAHVVCALYIPEVRFGDVGTMEPIIFSSIPHERFIKPCFICDESGRESKSVNGACMNCHKSGCKLSFHVTCAQSRRQLCEEASVNGHVQYVGYCTAHWTRRFKQPPLIPPPSPAVNNSEPSEEKKVLRKGRSRNDSTSSTNSSDIPKPRGRRQKHADLSPDTRTTLPEIKSGDTSPARAEDETPKQEALSNKTTVSLSQVKLSDGSSNPFSMNGILTSEKLKGSSPLNTPVPTFPKQDAKVPEEIPEVPTDNCTEPKKTEAKKRKLNEKEKGKKKPRVKLEKEEKDKKKNKAPDSKKKEKNPSKEKEKVSEKKQKFPQPSKLGLVENGKVSSWESVTPKYNETPDNFQDFLEHQWNQTVHFMTSKAEHFDVASLLACLHQLKSDNLKLEKKLMNVQARRDRLLGVNARLAASFTDSPPENGNGRSPLSAMLSKLNDKPEPGTPQTDGEKRKQSPEAKAVSKKRPVASPDLAMLAAASVKLENETLGKSDEVDKNSEKTNSDTEVPMDEKPPSFNDQLNINSMLLQPSVTRHGNDSLLTSSFDRLLNDHRPSYNHVNLFSDATEVDQETSSARNEH